MNIKDPAERSLDESVQELDNDTNRATEIELLNRALTELYDNMPETFSDEEADFLISTLSARLDTLQDAKSNTASLATGYLDIVKFLRIIIVNLWLIIIVGVLGTVLAYFVIEGQTSVYEGRTSVAVLPTYDDIPRPIDNIGVAMGTYVQVLRSESLKQGVETTLSDSYSEAALSQVEIEIRPVQNSSIIIIFARSSNPELARDYASEIANQVINQNPLPLFEVAYRLNILDTPELPTDPVYPDKKIGLALGAIGSLAVGVMVAFLWETYARSRSRKFVSRFWNNLRR